MNQLSRISNAVTLLACLYSLLSAPQPRPAVMILLIVAAACNAGLLLFALIYRLTKK